MQFVDQCKSTVITPFFTTMVEDFNLFLYGAGKCCVLVAMQL
jgi:hypothetical protein